MGVPFELNLSLKDRAFEEQTSTFKLFFALAPYPLFPLTSVWAVSFRTGCTEGCVFGACPVLVLGSQLEASQLFILRLQNGASVAEDWLCFSVALTSPPSPVPHRWGQAASLAEPDYICSGCAKKGQILHISAMWPQTYPKSVNPCEYSIWMAGYLERALMMGSFLCHDQLLGQSPLNLSAPFCALLTVYVLTQRCLSHLVSRIQTGRRLLCTSPVTCSTSWVVSCGASC